MNFFHFRVVLWLALGAIVFCVFVTAASVERAVGLLKQDVDEANKRQEFLLNKLQSTMDALAVHHDANEPSKRDKEAQCEVDPKKEPTASATITPPSIPDGYILLPTNGKTLCITEGSEALEFIEWPPRSN